MKHYKCKQQCVEYVNMSDSILLDHKFKQWCSLLFHLRRLCLHGHENTHYVWFKTDKEACCTSHVLFASTDVKHLFLGLQSEHISPAEVERPSVSLQRVPRWLPGPGSLNVRLHLEAWSILRQREGSALPRGHHWQQALKNIQEWKCPLFNQVRLQHQSK